MTDNFARRSTEPNGDADTGSAADAANEAGLASGPLFFTVSRLKFIVMSIFTFGIYELYWIYKNWKMITIRKNLGLFPFWRAFFAYFFIYPLLQEIRKTGAANGMPENLKAGQISIWWIIVSLTWKLPDPIWLITTFNFVPLLPAVKYVNDLESKVSPDTPINSKFSVLNWVGIVFGAIFWPLCILGMLIGD
jgi:hypothetical protein